MKPVVIRSVETFPLRLTADGQRADNSGYAVAANRPTIYAAGRETLFVRIESEQGDVGWGEALAPVAPRVPAAIVEDLLTPAMIGADAADVKPLRHRLGELMRERGHLVGHQADALAAVDIALWDLLGHATGLPVANLLGGAYRRTIPSYVTSVGGSTDAERAQAIRELWAGGARRFKLHLGNGVDADLASYAAAAGAVPEAQVAVDVHCVYDVPDALRLGRELQARGAWFLESALPAENLRGYAELAARLDLPIAGGEAFRNRYEVADWLAASALDYLQPDIGRTGITEGDAIWDLAKRWPTWRTGRSSRTTRRHWAWRWRPGCTSRRRPATFPRSSTVPPRSRWRIPCCPNRSSRATRGINCRTVQDSASWSTRTKCERSRHRCIR
jgi:galactonate dehydratase